MGDISRAVRRKVLEISVTKFERANRPRARNNDGRTEIPLRDTACTCVGGSWRISCSREKPRDALKVEDREREALTNFWRILYCARALAPCPISIVPFHILSLPHTTALFPDQRFADSFFAPQIARAVYVAGLLAPRCAIQPLFCLAVVAPVCPVPSRLAQSA